MRIEVFWSMNDEAIQLLLEPGNKSNRELYALAGMLKDCEWDRDLMRLKYADEISEIVRRWDDMRYGQAWNAPAGYQRGQLNVFAVGKGVGRSVVVDIETFS